MTPAELREARQSLGLTLQQLAAQLGVNTRTVAGWESGTRNNGKRRDAAAPVPKAIALAIQTLRENGK